MPEKPKMIATAPEPSTDAVPAAGRATIVPPGQGDSYWVVGDLITFKIGADRTGGGDAFAETTVAPGGPPPHLHHREDELFYVLDGDFALTPCASFFRWRREGLLVRWG